MCQMSMTTNWYKMAAIMNRYCENDGIEEVWEAECASLYQKGPNLDKAKLICFKKYEFSHGYRARPIHRRLWFYLQL
ncbi:hypothetical protein C0J52_00332 [Blattella germanica]|nr:hypothetical protein C0J52_00332 [Blattella germanica]